MHEKITSEDSDQHQEITRLNLIITQYIQKQGEWEHERQNLLHKLEKEKENSLHRQSELEKENENLLNEIEKLKIRIKEQ